ncbi:hypothetical protein BDB01DRAFT_908970 [Pilobolus umbonatus]|nr:hypothetical protein BDB01DRAFT_908970 [Pilobolus umbonatus]
MNHLSPEIIELIADKLIFKDLSHCLTINHLWYSIIIRHLYTRNASISSYRVQLFLESLTLYPRCREAGMYVKKLDISGIQQEEKYSIHGTQPIDFADSLIHCPQLEELYVRKSSYVTDIILSERMPQLNRLRKLMFYSSTDSIVCDYLGCLYKFRSTLTSLTLSDSNNAFDHYSAHEFLSYLEAFTQLRSLSLIIYGAPFGEIAVFDSILNYCPGLTHFTYNCEALYTPTRPHYTHDVPMESLELRLHDFFFKDIQYIKERMTQLKKITINTSSAPDSTVIKELLTIETLKMIKLNIFDTEYLPMNDALFNYGNHYFDPTQTIYSLAIYTCIFEEPILMSVTTCQETGVKSINSCIASCHYDENNYQQYLENVGSILNHLSLNFDSVSVDGLQSINRLCPLLTELSVITTRLTADDQYRHVNNNLVKLRVQAPTDTRMLFREIEHIYPYLKTLHYACEDYGKNNTLQLPRGLIRLELCVKYASIVLVIKKLDGVSLMSWHYDQQLIVTEAKDINSLIEKWPSGSKLCILESSTLEEVCFMTSFYR